MSICNTDCSKCSNKEKCKGCLETCGHPFSGECVLAKCCDYKKSGKSLELIEKYKAKLINEFNDLNIDNMPKVNDLYALKGEFINMEYVLENGLKVKFWNDSDIYLGNQLAQNDSDKCFGIAANNNYLMVCEYDKNGLNPEIIVYKKRK